MVRILSYTVLFVVTLLLQVFFFDNLALSVYLTPLIYITFIALLPMETPPVVMLGCGLMMGLAMDWCMGLEGINTATTLLAAFSRRLLLQIAGSREMVREGGVPTVWRMGNYSFSLYLLLIVGLHHLCFFLLESLSWSLLPFVLVRFALSTLVTMLFAWLLSQLLTSKLSVL